MADTACIMTPNAGREDSHLCRRHQRTGAGRIILLVAVQNNAANIFAAGSTFQMRGRSLPDSQTSKSVSWSVSAGMRPLGLIFKNLRTFSITGSPSRLQQQQHCSHCNSVRVLADACSCSLSHGLQGVYFHIRSVMIDAVKHASWKRHACVGGAPRDLATVVGNLHGDGLVVQPQLLQHDAGLPAYRAETARRLFHINITRRNFGRFQSTANSNRQSVAADNKIKP